MKNYFITSDGRKIDFIADYYEAKKSWPYNITNFAEFVDKCIVNPTCYPQNEAFFANKLAVFNYFVDSMKECFLLTKWSNVLDIGCGSAVIPRLMKGANLCHKCYGIDIVDRSVEINPNIIKQYIENFSYNESNLSIPLTQNYLSSYHPFLVEEMFSKSNFRLGNYIVDDFVSHRFKQKFDCITAFMCIEYFDPDILFEKVSQLLTKGGVFFIIVDYWYHIYGSSMELPMDAPWLHARTTKDDLLRYYDEYRPEISHLARKAIYFAQDHMTVIDYKNKASNHGLKSISYRRGLSEPKSVIVLPKIKNVLFDAKSVNYNVELSDLFTYYLTMIFRKD